MQYPPLMEEGGPCLISSDKVKINERSFPLHSFDRVAAAFLMVFVQCRPLMEQGRLYLIGSDEASVRSDGRSLDKVSVRSDGRSVPVRCFDRVQPQFFWCLCSARH